MNDETTKPRTVKVGCRMVNGVTLRLFEKGADDGTGSGYRPIVPVGPDVVLRGPSGLAAGVTAPGHGEPEFTDVDAGWFEKWLEQNKQTIMVSEKFVYAVEE